VTSGATAAAGAIDVRPLREATRKEVPSATSTKAGKPVLNRGSGLFGDFELNRSTCFLLDHRRPIAHPAADTHIIDLHPDEITSPEFAVDGEVEQCEVAFSPLTGAGPVWSIHLSASTGASDR
jgi:hypothetical protein